jgi:hypothetical protein
MFGQLFAECPPSGAQVEFSADMSSPFAVSLIRGLAALIPSHMFTGFHHSSDDSSNAGSVIKKSLPMNQKSSERNEKIPPRIIKLMSA